MTNQEFETILTDVTKAITGDIVWSEDEDHSPALEFRAEIHNDAGTPLFVRGSFNPLAKTLSFSVIHRGVGRIYGLDMGKDHHNPTCNNVGELHKHRWSDVVRDKEAYVPVDITEPVSNPLGVWDQFCAEFNLQHLGTMAAPPAVQAGIV